MKQTGNKNFKTPRNENIFLTCLNMENKTRIQLASAIYEIFALMHFPGVEELQFYV